MQCARIRGGEDNYKQKLRQEYEGLVNILVDLNDEIEMQSSPKRNGC